MKKKDHHHSEQLWDKWCSNVASFVWHQTPQSFLHSNQEKTSANDKVTKRNLAELKTVDLKWIKWITGFLPDSVLHTKCRLPVDLSIFWSLVAVCNVFSWPVYYGALFNPTQNWKGNFHIRFLLSCLPDWECMFTLLPIEDRNPTSTLESEAQSVRENYEHYKTFI